MRAHELEVGTEFSHDEGRSWGVVKSIKYVSEESTDLDVWVQPSDDTRLSTSYHITLTEDDFVHFDRHMVSSDLSYRG